MTKQNSRFGSFDTLKFIAVLLCTTIGHYYQFTPISYQRVCETGWMTAVVNFMEYITSKHTHSLMELLFLIGGFQIYIAYHDRIKEAKITFFEYFKKRVIRLYPPMIISVVVMSIGLILFEKLFSFEWRGVYFLFKAFVMSILGVQAWTSDVHVLNGPLWYLSVYILCIIVYYFIERFSDKYKAGIFPMFVPVIMALSHYFNPSVTFTFLNKDICRGFYGFFIGCILACAYRTFNRKQITIVSTVLILASIVLYTVFYEAYLVDETERAIITCLILYGPVILLLASYPALDRIIGCRPLAFLGKASFHLYCLNFPFLLWAMLIPSAFGYTLLYDSFYIYILFIIVQVVMSIALYYLIDKKLCPYLEKALNKTVDK